MLSSHFQLLSKYAGLIVCHCMKNSILRYPMTTSGGHRLQHSKRSRDAGVCKVGQRPAERLFQLLRYRWVLIARRVDPPL